MVFGLATDNACVQKVREISIEGDLTQADDNADLSKGLNLLGEVLCAVANLLRQWLVAGRGAANDGGDPGMAKFESVVTRDGLGFVGKTEIMENRIHEVPRAVTGKGASGAVGPMGTGSESKDQDAGTGISKARNRTGPIRLVLIGAATGFSQTATVVAQPGTAFTRNNGVSDLF